MFIMIIYGINKRKFLVNYKVADNEILCVNYEILLFIFMDGPNFLPYFLMLMFGYEGRIFIFFNLPSTGWVFW